MPAFPYTHGQLHCEAVPLFRIAETVGTPVYVYSANRIRQNYRRLKEALIQSAPAVQLHYAIKANSNLSVLRILAELGAGADIVSGGELKRALAAGVDPQHIVFSGVGKTTEELQAALQAGIHQINVESIEEIEKIASVAAEMGVVASIAFRLNPDVAADTHDKIATGRKGDKFGIDHEQMLKAAETAKAYPSINFCGIAVHIGSQLFDLDIYRAAFTVVRGYVEELRAAGYTISRLDLGGGMGVPYREGDAVFDTDAFAVVVRETVGDLGCTLSFEPGRFIVADAGVLLSRIVQTKEGVTTHFAVVDAAMTDLIRPAFYESWHTIIPVREPVAGEVTRPIDVVGPVCESSDCFAKERDLPPLKMGDLVVFKTAGAYGAAMSSTYNSRALVPEVMVDGGEWRIIRQRVDIDQQLAWER